MKCATFKTQVAESANLRVFVGMVKGDTELKLFHSMLRYNSIFVAQNLSGNVMAFMGDIPLEGRTWYSRYHSTRHGHVRILNF